MIQMALVRVAGFLMATSNEGKLHVTREREDSVTRVERVLAAICFTQRDTLVTGLPRNPSTPSSNACTYDIDQRCKEEARLQPWPLTSGPVSFNRRLLCAPIQYAADGRLHRRLGTSCSLGCFAAFDSRNKVQK